MPDDPPPPAEGQLGIIQQPQTLSGTAVVDLSKEVERLGGQKTVQEQIALSDQTLRKIMVGGFVGAVLIGDVISLIALWWWSRLDQANLEHKLILAGERIVDHQVVFALLGATTVQVGLIAAIIARYLFPGRSGDK